MAASSALSPWLPADVSGRRQSINIERSAKVTDDNQYPALHQYQRPSSSASSSLQIASEVEPVLEGSLKRNGSVRPDSAEIRRRSLEHDDDDDCTLNMETTSRRRQTEATEHKTTSTSTVSVPNSAVDRSSSDAEDEQQPATSVNLRSTFWHKQSAVARSISFFFVSPHTKDFGTQTVQERWTQTNVEQSTQTDELHLRGGIAEDLQQDGQYCDSVDTVHSRRVQSDQPHDVSDVRDSASTTMMADFAQQTTMTSWTQTPVRLRLGTDGRLADVPDGVPPMPVTFRRAATDHRVTAGFVNRKVALDNEFDVVQSRDFGTQTFGLFTADLIPTSEAQTFSARQHRVCSDKKSKVGASDKVKDRSRDKPKDRNSEGYDVQQYKPFSVLQDPGKYASMSAKCSGSRHAGKTSMINEHGHHRRHRHHHRHSQNYGKLRKEIDDFDVVQTDGLKHRYGSEVNCDRCSACSSRHDASRMDLLKLMLHQVKDLKDKASSVAKE